MKVTAVFAALAASALAAPTGLEERTAAPQVFGIMAARSASPIHLQQVNAVDNFFYIGKPTKSYCPPNVPKGSCGTGNSTVFELYNSAIGLDVVSPGGQDVFIGPHGALRFTSPHEEGIYPAGSITDGFKITPTNNGYGILTNSHGGFVACPVKPGCTEGPYMVFIATPTFTSSPGCLGFDALAPSAKGPGAFEYV